jgi:hypothetical protein
MQVSWAKPGNSGHVVAGSVANVSFPAKVWMNQCGLAHQFIPSYFGQDACLTANKMARMVRIKNSGGCGFNAPTSQKTHRLAGLLLLNTKPASI